MVGNCALKEKEFKRKKEKKLNNWIQEILRFKVPRMLGQNHEKPWSHILGLDVPIQCMQKIM